MSRDLDGVRASHLRQAVTRVEALTHDERSAIRRRALRALLELDGPCGERLARGCLEKDADSRVREECAMLLAGSSGAPATIAALVKASHDDSEERVKFVASETLRKLGVEQPRSMKP